MLPRLDSRLGGLLSNKGAVFVDGAKYNVDPRLIAAIAMEEIGADHQAAGYPQQHRWHYRAGTHGVGGDYMSYGSIDEGIEAAARNLRHRYLDQGLNTIEKIGGMGTR